LDIYLP
jgi:hypothetical protein